jgi:hypothetical protein
MTPENRILMPLTARRALLATLPIPALLLAAACSGQSGKHSTSPGSAAASSTVAITGSPAASGKTLTVAQLEGAALTAAELPSGYTLVADSSTPLTPTAVTEANPACQPISDLVTNLGKAPVAVNNSYQGPDAINVGGITLASYPPAEAEVFFASLKWALASCTVSSYLWKGTTITSTITAKTAPKVGDDSISFETITPGTQGVLTNRIYDFVRVGADAILLSNTDFGTFTPTISQDMLTSQIAKLKATQGS